MYAIWFKSCIDLWCRVFIIYFSNYRTPTLSDPGYRLVDACLKQGIKVNGLPGPSSITMGLSLTGFPADRFLFEGYFNFKINISRFLPKK